MISQHPQKRQSLSSFPDGVTSAELPTIEALSLSALQFLAANGEEWFALFSKPAMNAKERHRFDHLSQQCVRSLLDEAPLEAVNSLNSRQKAQILVNFMTASPTTTEQIKAMAAEKGDDRQMSITGT